MPFFPQFSNLFVPPFVPALSLVDGLLAYWNLNATSWLDSSGNGNNLTAVGSPTNPSGLLGNSASGFTTSDYLITGSGLAPLSGSRTYSCWIYLNNNNVGYQWIFTQGGSSDYQSIVPFYLESDGTLGSLISTDTGNWTNILNTGFVPTNNEWHHLVLTVDGSIARLYYDGYNIVNDPYSGSILAPDIDRFTIGENLQDPFEDPFNLDGKIDEIGIWNRALTGAEITSLYNAGAGKTYPFN